ncbi:MAG: AEC family transporter [Pseudomonadota bacterium]
MELIYVLTDPILPVFAIMAIGFVMGRTMIITVDDARVVNRFAMTILMPILGFDLIANAPIYTFSIAPILIYACGQLLVFLIGFYIAANIFKFDSRQAVLLAFCSVFPNTVLYILPISKLLYGADQILPITTIITWDASIAFGAVIIALQMIDLGKVAPSKVAKTLGKNPLLLSMVAGLFVSLMRIEIPDSIQTFLDFNGAAAPPVALFALGVVLSQTRFTFELPIITFTLVKFIAFPMVIWLGFEIFAPDYLGRGQFLLGAAAPAGAMAFTLALLHGVKTDAIAQVIVITSVITLGSLALLA